MVPPRRRSGSACHTARPRDSGLKSQARRGEVAGSSGTAVLAPRLPRLDICCLITGLRGRRVLFFLSVFSLVLCSCEPSLMALEGRKQPGWFQALWLFSPGPLSHSKQGWRLLRCDLVRKRPRALKTHRPVRSLYSHPCSLTAHSAPPPFFQHVLCLSLSLSHYLSVSLSLSWRGCDRPAEICVSFCVSRPEEPPHPCLSLGLCPT